MSKKGETLITPMGDLTPEKAPSVVAQDVRGREEEEARRGFHARVNAAEPWPIRAKNAVNIPLAISHPKEHRLSLHKTCADVKKKRGAASTHG